MANIKISELPAATLPLTGSELVPIVQSGTTDQVTVAGLTAGRTVNAAAVTATGTVSGATVTATGTVSGATVTASGTVSGTTVSGTTVSGATVSGTTVVAGAGTAAAPSISPTGDSNTGLFFPAADTIAFAEGGVEAMRLDASGNVGIGVTAPIARLHVRPSANQNFHVAGSISLPNSLVLAGVNDANNANIPVEIRYATNLGFFEGNTERARINASGLFSCLLLNSLTSNGYTRLPNGVYLQWGSASANTSGATTSFPIAFPTACWIVVAVNQNQTNPPAPGVSFTSTNFTMTVTAGSPTCSWFAVGI